MAAQGGFTDVIGAYQLTNNRVDRSNIFDVLLKLLVTMRECNQKSLSLCITTMMFNNQ